VLYGFAPQIWPGFTPYEIGKLLLTPDFPGKLAEATWPTSWRLSSIDQSLTWLAILSVQSACTYAAIALLLTWHAVRGFEFVAGRARRSKQTQPASIADSKAHGVEKAKSVLPEHSEAVSVPGTGDP
jgi:hypothetical protein